MTETVLRDSEAAHGGARRKSWDGDERQFWAPGFGLSHAVVQRAAASRTRAVDASRIVNSASTRHVRFKVAIYIYLEP